MFKPHGSLVRFECQSGVKSRAIDLLNHTTAKGPDNLCSSYSSTKSKTEVSISAGQTQCTLKNGTSSMGGSGV